MAKMKRKDHIAAQIQLQKDIEEKKRQERIKEMSVPEKIAEMRQRITMNQQIGKKGRS